MTWFYLSLAGAVVWAIAALAQKNACNGEQAIQVSVASTTVWAFFALFLIPFIKIPKSLPVLALMLVSGTIFGMAYYLSSKAFKYLSTSEASPLYNIGTAITVVLAIIFLKEKISVMQLLGVSTIIFGTYILEMKKGSLLSPLIRLFKSEKVHYVLFSALGYSVLAVLSKYILGFVDPITFLFSQLIICSIFMLILSILRHGGLKDIVTGIRVHRWTILLISVMMVVGQLFEISALNLGDAALVMPILRMWTLIAVVVGGTYLKEGHLRNRIIATVIMLVGVFIIYL